MALSKYWEGCNVSPLRKIEELTNIGRKEFMRECLAIINDTKKNAEMLGLDPFQASIPIIRRLSEESLYFFTWYIIGGGDPFYDNDFMYRLCLNIQKYKWGRIWVMAREHCKTTMITQISSIWEVIKNPKATFGIFSYKKPMAKKILKAIKTLIEGNNMLKVIWPDIFWANPTDKFEIRPDGTKIDFAWSTESLQLKQSSGGMDMTFEAHGIAGSSATGSHFSNLILDDCETLDNVSTPEAINSRYEEMMMAVNTGKTASLNLCFVGTFYAKEDAYSRIIKEGAVQEAIIQPCYDEDGIPIYYTEEELIEKRKKMGSQVAWATQMLCDPSMSSQNAFDENWLRIWEPDERNLKGLNIYTFVDPASDKVSKKHDYTVMITAGINHLGQILVLDIVRDKLRFEDKFSALIRIYKRFHPAQVFYEETAMASDTAHLTREMQKTNNFIPILPYSPIGLGSKSSRIEKLLFEFSEGNIYIPKYCYHTNWKGVRENVSDVCIREELFGYPNVSNDDFMDALAAICIFRTNGKLVLPEEVYAVGSNWSRSTVRKRKELSWEYNAMDLATGTDNFYAYDS